MLIGRRAAGRTLRDASKIIAAFARIRVGYIRARDRQVVKGVFTAT